MNITLNRSLFFLVAAAICLVIALLLSLSVLTGSNEQAWLIGGLLSFVLSFIP